ncbi:signal recognition particle-docking protein FtsY [Erwinia tracheiphila]|uniref:Signal recognition particle receptor FtsY n=1 Tax=Erwinia tracheiphila TaxID=65700 RepID=A0A0M2KHL0_9GAMM|nr:signal recognition particle-docking protein FtsY [Erwinia tracheiphila]EOS93656.1 signal recognition particle-docking protein FtsY [Erwinia tracheiphila PSU-1]KKF36461.1 cell division protein FtsY [Erwinia tracheiphila]UIA87795.1 signal recognition particle-docking protein FtsY [Erwinia tracheiphila]UIA96159.1 signal recognition particle-docking protein FtsY [Erwinia tracheiphila]
MAKNKKRGFFSWLGLGREEPTSEDVTKETPEDKQPAVDEVTDDTTPASPEAGSHSDRLEETADPDAVGQSVYGEPDASTFVNKQESADAVDVIQPELPALTADTEKKTEITMSQHAVEPQPAPEPLLPPEADISVPEQRVEARNDAETGVPTSGEQIDVNEPAAEENSSTAEQQRPTKEGFFARLKGSLVKTRQNLGSGFIGLFRGKKIDDDLFEELEEQLLIADVGVETTRRIITSLTQQANRKQLRDAEALYGLLKQEMSEILAKVESPLDVAGETPFVILMVGVNGVGKTTTIGKLARQYQAEGKSVMLAAGDTFRAAAVEQLQVWGQRNDIPVVAQHTGADSASVIFDAIQAAKARHVDVLIADTAGRLQNKSHLMEELKKITRVMKKLDEQAPHEVMLTIDASTGQNAISQTKLFHEAVGLTGITLTKLDGTAKGGVIFSVADQFGIPIRYIGVGEGIEDLRSFKADDFIEALFAREDS